MLKMHVPDCLSTWFNTQKHEETKWITKRARHKKGWIFPPREDCLDRLALR